MKVHVVDEAFDALKKSLETTGEEYKNRLARLQNLINEITSGSIQGDPANDLLAKFQAKEDIFKGLAQTIDDAEEYMGIKKAKFGDVVGGLSTRMH